MINNTTIVYKADVEEGSCLYFLVVNGYSRYGFENWKHQLFTGNDNLLQYQRGADGCGLYTVGHRLTTLFYDTTKDEKAGVFSNDYDDYFECVPKRPTLHSYLFSNNQ